MYAIVGDVQVFGTPDEIAALLERMKGGCNAVSTRTVPASPCPATPPWPPEAPWTPEDSGTNKKWVPDGSGTVKPEWQQLHWEVVTSADGEEMSLEPAAGNAT